MPNQWTINNAQGGRDSTTLVGCKIQVSANGQNYQFTAPNNNVLATTPGSTLPAVPFSFPQFPIPGGSAVWNWNITVDTLTAGQHQNKAEGRWTNTDPNPSPAEDESGTWTAQAGSGMGEEGTDDAASAYA